MPDLDLVTVLVGTVALFVLGAAYYAVLGSHLTKAGGAAGSMRPWQVAVELGRCLVLAVVVVGIAAEAGIDGWTEGVLLGLTLWVGFPLVLWTGAVVHERTPVRLAALHGGDWLVKLTLLGVLVGVLA